MTTAADILTASFVKVGVDSPTAAQTATGLISLNNMITNWGAEGLLYSVVSEGFTIVAGDWEYTIGPGGQWDTVRPLAVKSCYLNNADNFDSPVRIISGRDYANYSNKSYTSKPTELYFLPEYPLAKIIFNTSPDSGYSAYFEFVKNFTVFASSTASATLPSEYMDALVYNLTVSLSEDWGRNINNTVMANAVRTKAVVEQMLAAQREVPRAKFDFSIGYVGITLDDLLDGGTF
jgi:hypothetical protein